VTGRRTVCDRAAANTSSTAAVGAWIRLSNHRTAGDKHDRQGFRFHGLISFRVMEAFRYSY
jgi:hypothetical protein